ncbi:MAG: hypothetical protein ALAOOOJD_04712 [bacterium]|nr:hypothetical protein [bacterium]
MFPQRRLGIQKNHAQLFPLFLQGMINHFGLILRADAAEKLALGLGNAEAIKRLLDIGRHVVPTPALLFARPDIIMNVVEVEIVQVAAPLRHGAFHKMIQRFQTDVAHPFRFLFVFGNLFDNAPAQAFAAFEDVFFRIGKAVFIIIDFI